MPSKILNFRLATGQISNKTEAKPSIFKQTTVQPKKKCLEKKMLRM